MQARGLCMRHYKRWQRANDGERMDLATLTKEYERLVEERQALIAHLTANIFRLDDYIQEQRESEYYDGKKNYYDALSARSIYKHIHWRMTATPMDTMRSMTDEEIEAYNEGLRKITTPTGRNPFKEHGDG